MKKIKVIWRNPSNPSNAMYTTASPTFSWISERSKKNFSKQLTGWHQCRETFTMEIVKNHNPAFKNRWKADMPISDKHLRIAVVKRLDTSITDTVLKREEGMMLEAKRVLNIFSKHLGWGLTNIYDAGSDRTVANNTVAYVITASKNWMHCPQLLSFYLLILRTAINPRLKDTFKNFNKFEDLIEVRKSINSSTKDPSKFSDMDRLAPIIPYLPLVFRNKEELFFNKSLKEQYCNNMSSHGITSLLNCKYGSMVKEWKKIKERHDKVVEDTAWSIALAGG